MKKTSRKLALNKETLRALTDEQAGAAEGGAILSTQYSRCNQSCGIACTVPHLTCTCQ